ncbi:unnamed protein product [Cylicocyclus nassatus]|uniref:Uncharacterized protein n=1 Tax=Cylicocyclus nassatus TaxID=53992 RepID=A0AA36H1B3_CYLNA|nr:unnamed protein product [Cylicocyclus nassatus]
MKLSKEVSPSPVLSREAGHTPKRSKESLSIRKRWKEISPKYSKESGTPKHSKESSSLLSHKRFSKEGLEESKSSLQRKIKRFASLTGFKSQKTQADKREESFKSERSGKAGLMRGTSPGWKRKRKSFSKYLDRFSYFKHIDEEKRTNTPSRRRKLVWGLRKKESQKIPVREVEAVVPPRLSDISHAHCEIVDVQELQHKIKVRRKQLRMISDIMCCVSITAIILSLTIALFGFSACYIAHIEYTVQKAAAMQMGKQWKSQCGRKKLQRMIYNNLYEETNCSLPSIEFAQWTNWSKCLKGSV